MLSISPPRSRSRPGAWSLAAWGVAAITAAVVAMSVLRLPVQVTDSLVVLLQVQADPSPGAVFQRFLGYEGFFRPLFWTTTRVLLDLSDGHYFATFRGFHVAVVSALFLLFTLAARVRTPVALASFAFALLVLTGHNAFLGSVWEAYPINHYLIVALCCTAALVLAQSAGAWWKDVLAGVLFVAAATTLETGLIVWVVFVTAYVAGLRGVSRRGVVLVTLLLAGYFWFRFVYLPGETPTFSERSTGYGFGRLEPDEVVARFAAAPQWFYAYNVVSSALAVVLSEPRGGTWIMTSRLVHNEVTPSAIVSFASALLTTGMILWFVAVRIRHWVARRFEHADQLVLVSLGVIAANAAFCYIYTKDEIMSTAAVFYALAAYGAVSHALTRFAAAPRAAVSAVALSVVLATASGAWLVRSVGLHYQIYYQGFTHRSEWALVDDWLRDQRAAPGTPEGTRLVESLKDEATQVPVLNQFFLPRWGERWFR